MNEADTCPAMAKGSWSMECDLDTFPSPEELWGRLVGVVKFEDEKDETDALSQYWQEVGGKAPRYYQQVAINKAVNAVVERGEVEPAFRRTLMPSILDRAFKGEL
jgi:type I site-specific restriction endonuclease